MQRRRIVKLTTGRTQRAGLHELYSKPIPKPPCSAHSKAKRQEQLVEQRIAPEVSREWHSKGSTSTGKAFVLANHLHNATLVQDQWGEIC